MKNEKRKGKPARESTGIFREMKETKKDEPKEWNTGEVKLRKRAPKVTSKRCGECQTFMQADCGECRT